MAKQQSFKDKTLIKPGDSFGGSLLKNSHAKTKRPLDSKLPIHLVLRAEKSILRTPLNFGPVNQVVAKACKKHGVRIYKYANVGNHLHLVIKIPRVHAWAAFIRELTGRIAQTAQGLRGPTKAQGRFWRQRPFTRIVRGWKKAFQLAKQYVELNFLEAEGFIRRIETRTLNDLRLIFNDS